MSNMKSRGSPPFPQASNSRASARNPGNETREGEINPAIDPGGKRFDVERDPTSRAAADRWNDCKVNLTERNTALPGALLAEELKPILLRAPIGASGTLQGGNVRHVMFVVDRRKAARREEGQFRSAQPPNEAPFG
ncbi:hypothetical protein KM043_004477 [Ampulex compressa]|nr:hypothetical protein KM043_004477 [Ampulex compressa]